jgi:hypothetical protein
MRAAVIGFFGLIAATSAQAQQAANFDLSCDIETSVKLNDRAETKTSAPFR